MKNSIRISITQKCNLSCPYCHREGQAPTNEEMDIVLIKKIAASAKEAGIKKVKITGGEPLLRKDILEIVSAFRGFDDVSLVTNGVLLDKYAKALKDSGLDRINIGCDSLNNGLLKNRNRMINGLFAAKDAGLFPIKINMVVLKGINDNEIGNMVGFARENNAILQLIELINTDAEFYRRHYFSLEKTEKNFRKKAVSVTKRDLHNRHQYDIGGVVVEVVRPFHNGFCGECGRIRITAGGKIKTCLLRNDNLTDFKDTNSLLAAMRATGDLP